MSHTHFFWIKLAEVPVYLSAQYAYMEEFCSDYRIEPCSEDRETYAAWQKRNGKDGQLPVSVSEEEIAAEWTEEGELSSLAYLETLALYRKICRELLSESVLLFHASAFSFDGRGVLVTAPSGTGKSTHVRLWRESFGDRVTVINDDKPLLRFPDHAKGTEPPDVYGTPYAGKDYIQKNTSAPVCGILVLHQAAENRIRQLPLREAFPLLWRQTFCERNSRGAVIKTMDLVQRLCELPVFSLGCTISEDAVRTAARALGL